MFVLYIWRGLQTKSAAKKSPMIGAGAPGLELIESIKEEQASSTLQEIKGEIGCVEEPTLWSWFFCFGSIYNI